jgi:lysozyme
MRAVNKEGLSLIKSFESCSLEAYADPASPLGAETRKSKAKRASGWEKLSGEPWTVGWGSTGLDYFNLDANGQPKRIGPGTKWTQAQADERNGKDLEKFSAQVIALLQVPVSDNQFAALVSFAYNCGVGNLKSSTLLRKVNESKFTEAAAEFLKWDKAQGQVMPGLTRRREAEKALFLKKSS